MILDIHTHCKTANPLAIIDISDEVAKPGFCSETLVHYPGYQLFSVGIHPWTLTEEVSSDHLAHVTEVAKRRDVALIGETGIDTHKGGPLFRQLTIFKTMAELAEKVGKPLLIHDVKAHDIIIGLYRDMRPVQPWIIHGFRQNQSVAEMLMREGFYLSFGPAFNPVTVHTIPTDRMLAESDDSGIQIPEVIHLLSDTRGFDLTETIAANTARVLSR